MSIRAKVGKLINANASEVAMTDNVTHGMSYLASGITLKAGEEVLTTNQEHSGGQSSFMVKAKRYGTGFRTVTIGKPIKETVEVYEDILKAIRPETKVLMISYIISGSGAILPVKEILQQAHKRGILYHFRWRSNNRSN